MKAASRKGPAFFSNEMGKEIIMTDFRDLLKIRRSVRDYLDKEVPLEIVQKIITESCLAPSSSNGQP